MARPQRKQGKSVDHRKDKRVRHRYLSLAKLMAEDQDIVRECTRWLDEQDILYVKNYKIEPVGLKSNQMRAWRRTMEQGTPNLVVFLPGKTIAVKIAHNGKSSKPFEKWWERAGVLGIKVFLARSFEGFKMIVQDSRNAT